mmetsp:Transcript_24022/g.43547  ORF Transcript_24022/g.43547 Transcript_24022/m.43547 type:complete len:93 (+) Transcript_24022:46-324(+)
MLRVALAFSPRWSSHELSLSGSYRRFHVEMILNVTVSLDFHAWLFLSDGWVFVRELMLAFRKGGASTRTDKSESFFLGPGNKTFFLFLSPSF